MKVGVLVIATGKYDMFFEELYDSFEEFFLPGHPKHYFFLTDSKKEDLPYNVDKFYIKRQGFPQDTLFRYKYFLTAEKEIRESGVECLYYTDVDMKAIATMGDEILPSKEKPIVAVAHPGFYKTNLGTPETRRISKAFIKPTEYREHYVAGGFQGGLTNDYLSLSKTINQMIDSDYEKGIIPVWNDESMWNRYYTTNISKIKVLTPEYCYPEGKYKNPQMNNYHSLIKYNLTPRLLALDKDHNWVRS